MIIPLDSTGHLLRTHSYLYKTWCLSTNQICLLVFCRHPHLHLVCGLIPSKMILKLCEAKACKNHPTGKQATPPCCNFSLQDQEMTLMFQSQRETFPLLSQLGVIKQTAWAFVIKQRERQVPNYLCAHCKPVNISASPELCCPFNYRKSLLSPGKAACLRSYMFALRLNASPAGWLIYWLCINYDSLAQSSPKDYNLTFIQHSSWP